MPSTRSQPLNPRLAALQPGTARSQRAPATAPALPVTPAAAPDDAGDEAAEAARAGGFHESSYELRSGLDVNESEWPGDTTIPGALGDR